MLRYEQHTKVHSPHYQTGSNELKIEVELQQIGERGVWKINTTQIRKQQMDGRQSFTTMHPGKKKKKLLHIFFRQLLP